MGLITGTAWMIVKVFFSTTEIVNFDHIPTDEPLLVVVNHNNQFIDAAVIVSALPRKLSFIIAESSMHKPIVGSVARWSNAVPVVRPQDKAISGQGKIVSINLEARTLEGEGTTFTNEELFKRSTRIDIRGMEWFKITEIISDTQVTFSLEDESEEALAALQSKVVATGETSWSYRIIPKINQKEVYTEVHNRLKNNGAVVIFPEGGSHDRSHLLPLKNGVAAMALGALASDSANERLQQLKILPVGINYFNAHTFRSKVLIEVGSPIAISKDVYKEYKRDRQQGYATLMSTITTGLEDVTLNAPDYKTQEIIRTARRLYQNGCKIGPAEYLTLFRRFLKKYPTWMEDENFVELKNDIADYLRILKSMGLDDKRIESVPPSNSCATLCSVFFEILISLMIIACVLSLALPGLILHYPLYLFINAKVSKEVNKALKKSKVKVKAWDVIASQKVLNTIKYLPLLYLFNSILLLLVLFFAVEQRENVVFNAMEEELSFIEDHLFWIAPLCFFVIFPIYTLLGVRVLDSAAIRSKLLPTQFYILWQVYSRSVPSCLGGKRRFSPATDVRVKRRELVLRTQDLVLDLTKDDPEWQADPIITQEQMEGRRYQLAQEVVHITSRRGKDQKLMLQLKDPELQKAFDEV